MTSTAPVNEAWVIAAMQERLGNLGGVFEFPGVRISVPMASLDDCALMQLESPTKLVVGCDYIRGRQFDLFRFGHLSYFDLGYYLIAANLSDIASMGAIPIGATIILRYPPDLMQAQATQLIDGIVTACEMHGPCPVLGGDSGGATDLILGATVIGRVTANPLLRSTAQPGDSVYVLGYPGRAKAAELLFACDPPPAVPLSNEEKASLLDQWRRPHPLLKHGQILSQSGHRIACQDTSDGLKTTLSQIAVRSNVGIRIRERDITVEPLLRKIASSLNVNPLELYFRASVDFGLVFTLPKDVEIDSITMPTGPTIQYVGQAHCGSGQLMLERIDGTIESNLPGEDYSH